jgi:hypothetical protein
MQLDVVPYPEQSVRLPLSGKHVIAQYDEHTLAVYQAYNRTIAEFAVANGHFGAGFSYARMSWIKPNFLWMMYRCGWGTKDANQERVLAIRLRRAYFDQLLVRAVPSSFAASFHDGAEAWRAELASSDVRLQWDPDHDPSGAPLERRAIQLGLRGSALEGFRGDAIVDIEDITTFVRAQHRHVEARAWDRLLVPSERAYPVSDPEARRRLGLRDEP